jgi:hypothetical protein
MLQARTGTCVEVRSSKIRSRLHISQLSTLTLNTWTVESVPVLELRESAILILNFLNYSLFVSRAGL